MKNQWENALCFKLYCDVFPEIIYFIFSGGDYFDAVDIFYFIFPAVERAISVSPFPFSLVEFPPQEQSNIRQIK